VRDTPFERKQHESTAKHQTNLKRFLRDIQNNHERDEREKQKAKAEVERLNKLTGGGTAQPVAASSTPTIRKSTTGALTAVDQKRQWSQLAEMGIQVPDQFRGEMAMASNWQVAPKPKSEETSGDESLSKGVRKRKLEGDEGEEEEQQIEQPSRKAWGKTTKSYPGQDASNLDALLSSHLPLKKERTVIKDEEEKLPEDERSTSTHDSVKEEPLDTDDNATGIPGGRDARVSVVASEGMNFKAEEAADTVKPLVKPGPTEDTGETTISQANTIPVFKKRKPKATSNTI
jgi:hypothetical protein